MYTVTRSWLDQFRTPGRAWNKVQMDALGVSWPPKNGWLDRAIGTEISDHARTVFEAAAGPSASSLTDRLRLSVIELRTVRCSNPVDQRTIDRVIERLTTPCAPHDAN